MLKKVTNKWVTTVIGSQWTGDKDGSLIERKTRREYYIRHVDESPTSSEAERERVMQCLEAAIERTFQAKECQWHIMSKSNMILGLIDGIPIMLGEDAMDEYLYKRVSIKAMMCDTGKVSLQNIKHRYYGFLNISKMQIGGGVDDNILEHKVYNLSRMRKAAST
ncbi:ACT domain-containing protein ACR6-like protein [Tanacetum coccineum]